MSRPSLGICLITLNEEELIADVIKAASFADEIVLIDSFSKDKTKEIAESFGAKVIQREFQGFPKEKQFAIDSLNTDWVLCLDADEIITEELKNEVLDIVSKNQAKKAYCLKRVQVFMGKKLYHGRGIDYPLRMIKKGDGKYNDREAHESIVVPDDFEIIKLGGELTHYSSEDIFTRIDKIVFESKIEVRYADEIKIGFYDLFVLPIRYFINILIKKSAWKDGLKGLIWLGFFAFQIFISNALMYELEYKRNLTRK